MLIPPWIIHDFSYNIALFDIFRTFQVKLYITTQELLDTYKNEDNKKVFDNHHKIQYIYKSFR